MRRFRVNVNGNEYDITVEEIDASAAKAAPAPKAAPKAAPSAAAAGGEAVKSPMPGTILSVKVSVGQQVKKGDTVAVLEAMKMENEIPAPQDGTVSSVDVSNGATVETGATIVTLA